MDCASGGEVGSRKEEEGNQELGLVVRESYCSSSLALGAAQEIVQTAQDSSSRHGGIVQTGAEL